MRALADAAERSQMAETTLGALAEYVTSGSRDWSKYYAVAGAMFIRTQDINQNRLSLDAVAYVQLPEKVEGKRSLVRKGDLLITITGANVGKVAVVEQELPEAYVSQSVCLVRLRDPSLAKFLQLQLIARRGEKSALEAMAYGLGRPVLNLENVRAAPVLIGPPRIRAEIVAEVEKQSPRLDGAVANLKRVKANLKRYKAMVLQSAVDGQLIAGVPADAESQNKWVWSTCGDVIESIQAGASFKCVERPPIAGEVGVVKVSAVTWGEFDENESKTCIDPGRVRDALFIRPGDFLFSRANTIELVGACVIAKSVTKSLMLSDKILRFRLARGLEPGWLLICLQSRFGRSEIERLATGNQESMRNIGQDRIRQIRLPLPPITEQRRILAEVERRLSLIRTVEAEVGANLTRAQILRQAVLGRAFSGAAPTDGDLIASKRAARFPNADLQVPSPRDAGCQGPSRERLQGGS